MYFQNDFITLYHGDAREIIPTLSDITSVVTDPPYEINFMGKSFDRTGISYDSTFWNLLLQASLPGAHLISFGGNRTHHRIWCAIEDAGWEIQDCLMWLYGNGFAKSQNLKPAYEAICLARKPPIIIPINLECKVGEDIITSTSRKDSWFGLRKRPESTHVGRTPSNVLHDGSDEVIEEFYKLGPKGDGLHSCNTMTDERSAARFFWSPKVGKKERGEYNDHPCVKPLSLMKYLCTLVKQPEKNLILDPFCGSGSTLLACAELGIPCIGIEMDEHYCGITVKRISREMYKV